MPFFLVATLLLLAGVAFAGHKFSKLPSNIWLLFIAQPLGLSAASMVVLAGGLLGAKIAPNPQWATLPLTFMILMTAAGVIPAAWSMKKFGRRLGTAMGLSAAVIGSCVAAVAAVKADFSLLIIAAGFLGFSMAFVAQMRFAAIESLSDPKDIPSAVSVLMVGSMFAALLGPEVAAVGKDWLSSPHGFAGSFLGLAVMIIVAIVIVLNLEPIGVAEQATGQEARSISKIASQPIFIISVCSGAIGYAVMSYVMTAAPLSMHQIEGHDLQATKWVVQSHIIAMYLPSLFSALLIKRFGIRRLMAGGSLFYLVVTFVALSGHHMMHYWWAMVLLGVGWNFLYTSGTVLLPESYRSNERFKAQACNDFTIFFTQAAASLSAGWMLFSYGWENMIIAIFPVLLVMLLVSMWFEHIRKGAVDRKT
ncbi:MAG: MFS transporter [Kangiellaceae bacterium]|nr:MFS transporter [Kangiellaceae bacterium]